MKKYAAILVMALFLGTLPLLAIAAEHEHGSMQGGSMMKHGDMEHGKMEMDHSKMDHGSMEMHDGMNAAGGMLMLGEKTTDGVKAMAHMKDVRVSMAKMGMKTTHHFMLMFSDEKSGKAIDSGTVAVKITAPDGTTTGPTELMGMQGHFGADVVLDKPGKYLFKVGSRLADGTTRQYEFETTLK